MSVGRKKLSSTPEGALLEARKEVYVRDGLVPFRSAAKPSSRYILMDIT